MSLKEFTLLMMDKSVVAPLVARTNDGLVIKYVKSVKCSSIKFNDEILVSVTKLAMVRDGERAYFFDKLATDLENIKNNMIIYHRKVITNFRILDDRLDIPNTFIIKIMHCIFYCKGKGIANYQ